MAVNTTPKNSWVVYSAGEQNQWQHPQHRLRSRYIRTKDPLPVMNYKQLEDALPSSYDLPSGRQPMEGVEQHQALFSEEESLMSGERSKNYAVLIKARGSAGDEISVESHGGLFEITEVYVNGIQAEFAATSNTNLIFVIPQGATSGTVELVTSSGNTISAGFLKVVSQPQEESVEGIEQQPESLPLEGESRYYIKLTPTSGYVGEEISVDSDWDLSGITGVLVGGIQADFFVVSSTNLIFAIPQGATSGTVELTDSNGNVISAEILEVVSG